MKDTLLDQVVSHTGLPEKEVKSEVLRWINNVGLNEETLTLDELRGVLEELVGEVLLKAKGDLETS